MAKITKWACDRAECGFETQDKGILNKVKFPDGLTMEICNPCAERLSMVLQSWLASSTPEERVNKPGV